MLSVVFVPEARSLDLTGNWNFVENDTGTEQRSTFNQRFGLTFSESLTSAVSFSGAVTYNNNWSEKSGSHEILQPNMGLNITNDIFQARFAGYILEETDTRDVERNDYSWESSIGSAWKKQLWPSLFIRYGANKSKNDLSAGSAGASNQEYDRYGINVDWNLIFFKVFYGFDGLQSEDLINLTETENTNHFAKFMTSHTFWKDRMTVNFSQQYSRNEQEFFAKIGPSGFVLRKKALVRTMATSDTTPADSSLGADIPGIRDNDLSVAIAGATLQLPPQLVNIGMELSTLEPEVDTIYLYTKEDLVALAGVNPNDVIFSLYVNTNSFDDTTWSLVPLGAGGVTYNAASRRYEFTTGRLTKQFVKLVADCSLLAVPIEITEIEAYEKEVDTRTVQVNQRHDTDFGIAYKVTPTLNLDYSFSHEKSEIRDGTDTERDSHAGGLSWVPRSSLGMNLSVSQTHSSRGANPENTGRNYSVGMAVKPMNTLDFNFGVNRNESYEGGNRTSTGHSYDMTTNANLYRDLSSSMNLNYSNSKNEINGESSDFYGAQLRFTARISPKFTVGFTEQFNRSESTLSNTDSGNTDMNISWRVSEILSVGIGGGYFWQDNATDTTSLNLDVTMLLTSKTQLSLTYNYNRNILTVENYFLNWSWAISKFLSFTTFGNFQTTDDTRSDDIWSIGAQLSFRTKGL